MEPAAAGVLYTAENLLYGAAALVKGITHPTLPLKANLIHITSVPLPRSHHTLSVVKGRAYIFGGQTAPGNLADNDIHVVILPSSGVLEADYTTIKARPEQSGGEVPAPRRGHTSVVIGDSIYIFGGEGVLNENGRVWVFHTVRNTWSYLDPGPNSQYPTHRAGHAAAASDLPGPKDVTFTEKAPQQPADPAKVVPEPATADSWGTIFVLGGRNTETGGILADGLAFDVKTRTWSNIPTPSGPSLDGSSIARVGDRLYRFGGKTTGSAGLPTATSTTEFLDVSPVWRHAEGGTTPLSSGWSWEPLSPTSTSTAADDKSTGTTRTVAAAPSPRFDTALTSLTTGQGRHYLLLLNGLSPAPSDNTTLLDDIWAFQLPPEGASAAAIKDNIKHSLKQDSHEGHWAELGCSYIDAKGDGEGKVLGDGEGGMKGIGPRANFAVARGSEVDGASIVAWGGVNAAGDILGDGWLITVER